MRAADVHEKDAKGDQWGDEEGEDNGPDNGWGVGGGGHVGMNEVGKLGVGDGGIGG